MTSGGLLQRDTVLDIRLLGPIGAERDGEPVSLGGPRQRAVLARLALTPGRVVTVDRLVEDVWAGDPPATAVNTLQSYVSLLRRALGDPQLLRREGPGYMLAVDRQLLDVARFEDRVTAARTELGSDPGSALGHLEAGLGEWRGPVLADVADEDWARSAATRWNELRMEALEARFDALLALGRHGEAVAELEHIVEENPLREGFARRLMIALYRNGRQADALRVFRETRTLLADELGLDPTPALVELQARILNHDPELAAPASPWTPPINVAAVAEPVETPSAEPETSPVPLPGAVVRAASSAFVGRDRQLAQLHRIWDEITTGGTHAVLLQGEAGAGKSRLGARFAQEAHGRGAIVMWGRATAEVLVPFEPMVEAVRSIMRTVSPEARRRVATQRGLLALLLPELEQIVPEAHLERPDPSVERYLLFETMADLLRTESAEHPFLLVLDDLQWADVPSLTMIDHVLRHEHPGRLMVVATVRVPHEEPTPDLDRWAADLARDGLLTRITLDGLPTDNVAELLRINGFDDSPAADLRAATGGNAFFLTELIQHTEGALTGELPESIRAMIGLRLDRLDPVAARVLNLVVVAGQSATLPILVAATGLEGDQLLDATDAAIAAGLLVEDGAGRLAVPHALIGQAISARLGRTRRSDLHRRVANAIEQASEPKSSPSMLAHHLIEAGSLVERESRVAAGLIAGRHSLEIGAYEDAATWIERVSALITDQIGADDRAELALLRCDVARALGDRSEAIAAVRSAAVWARSTGDPMQLARVAEGWMMSLSGVGFDIGEPADPELVDLMERAIAELPDDQRRYQVRIRSMLTSVLVPDPDPTRRLRLAAEALAIAEADGASELIASAHLARRLALSRRDDLDERTEISLTAVREAESTPNVQLTLTTMLFALSDLLELGRMEEHLAMLDTFQTKATDLHLPLFDVYAQFIAASHELSAGRYAEARRLADSALAAGIRSHGRNAEVIHAGILYRLSLDTGHLAELLPEIRRRVAAHPRLRLWQIALVRTLTEAEDEEEAGKLLAELVDVDGLHLRDNQMFFPSLCALADVAYMLGDRERAEILYRALMPYHRRLAIVGLAGMSMGPVSRYAGRAAHAAGHLEEAEELLREAIGTCVDLGLRPNEALARSNLAALLRELDRPGDSAEADVEEATARSIAEAIGLALPG